LKRALKRVATIVPAARAEEARAAVLELFPEGFEERDVPGGLELVAYVADAKREERLRRLFGTVTVADVAEDWEDRWRAFHSGVRVGRLWVGPPWESAPRGAVAVVIDPGRAFGTGAHPTTRLCLELLGELPRGRLLDVGCGSGVLAIAGAKLGFAPVSAIDVDPEAVKVATRNAKVNGVPIDVRLTDALVDPLPTADTVLANLTLDALIALGPRVSATWLITSGYLGGDELGLDGWELGDRRITDGWAAELWVRQAK